MGVPFIPVFCGISLCPTHNGRIEDKEIEFCFCSVAKGWVPQIVGEASRLYDFRIKPVHFGFIRLVTEEMFGQSAADLSDFIGMLLACVENIQLASANDLGDASKAVER